jgi:predicted PurR-regulated permease PerM
MQMGDESRPTNNQPSQVDSLKAATFQSREAWRRLGLRVQSVTPSALAHGLLTLAVLAGGIWLVVASWPALMPFIVGSAVAYLLLPAVNFLDRFLPRLLAALLTMTMFVVVLALLVLALAVPLGQQLYRLYLALPSAEELRGVIDGLVRYIATLPEPTQERIQNVARQMADMARENAVGYLQALIGLGLQRVFTLVRSIGFLLGLLIIPTWLLTVLNEQRSAVRALNRLLPAGLRDDFWAVVRIVDRSFKKFFRVQLVLGVAVGTLLYAALLLFERQGWLDVRYPLLVALFVGLMQLIPSLGPYLGALPAVLAMITISLPVGLLALGLYLAVLWLANTLLGSRLQERLVRLHPAVLVLVLVALGAFGPVWLLLSAPIAAMVVDLFCYAYGRLADPARPAGLLPDEPRPPARDRAIVAPRRTPLVYRRSRRGAGDQE